MRGLIACAALLAAMTAVAGRAGTGGPDAARVLAREQPDLHDERQPVDRPHVPDGRAPRLPHLSRQGREGVLRRPEGSASVRQPRAGRPAGTDLARMARLLEVGPPIGNARLHAAAGQPDLSHRTAQADRQGRNVATSDAALHDVRAGAAAQSVAARGVVARDAAARAHAESRRLPLDLPGPGAYLIEAVNPPHRATPSSSSPTSAW